MLRSLIVLLFALIAMHAHCQLADSTAASASADSIARAKALKKKIYSEPRKATLMSTFLPGLGQAYNKKYWKIPIVYAGLGGFGYMFYYNNTQYNNFRRGVIAAYDGNPATTYDSLNYNPDQLQTEKLRYRKLRDFSIIGMAIFYIVNIIDANVDAHLKTFDVSDDLSMNVDPWYNFTQKEKGYGYAAGLSLKFNFK